MKLRKIGFLGLVVLLVVFASERSFAGLRVLVRPALPRAIVVFPPPAVLLTPVPRPAGPSGYLELNIVPKDADVYVDESFMGKASRFAGAAEYVSMAPGKHTVSLRREGFVTQNFVVDVVTGRVVELDVTLRALGGKAVEAAPPAPVYEINTTGTGTLSFNVEPVDAALYIDGNFHGVVSEFTAAGSPLVLRAGNHTVEIMKPGYETHSMTTEISDGKEKEIVVKLKKLG